MQVPMPAVQNEPIHANTHKKYPPKQVKWALLHADTPIHPTHTNIYQDLPRHSNKPSPSPLDSLPLPWILFGTKRKIFQWNISNIKSTSTKSFWWPLVINIFSIYMAKNNAGFLTGMFFRRGQNLLLYKFLLLC